MGLLAPAVADARGVPRGDDVFVAELDLDRLTALAPRRRATRVELLPRFPSAVRDVSLLVPDSLSAAPFVTRSRAAAPPTLVSVREFDRYQGQGTPPGNVSVSLRCTFRAADRTLTDEEVADGDAADDCRSDRHARRAAAVADGRGPTMAKTMGAGVEPFDRLEEKIKLLVSTIARLKGEQTRLADENTPAAARAGGAAPTASQQAEHAGGELTTLREERDLIRTRVGDMLAELDALNL